MLKSDNTHGTMELSPLMLKCLKSSLNASKLTMKRPREKEQKEDQRRVKIRALMMTEEEVLAMMKRKKRKLRKRKWNFLGQLSNTRKSMVCNALS